jgi:hypothetical protein
MEAKELIGKILLVTNGKSPISSEPFSSRNINEVTILKVSRPNSDGLIGINIDQTFEWLPSGNILAISEGELQSLLYGNGVFVRNANKDLLVDIRLKEKIITTFQTMENKYIPTQIDKDAYNLGLAYYAVYEMSESKYAKSAELSLRVFKTDYPDVIPKELDSYLPDLFMSYGSKKLNQSFIEYIPIFAKIAKINLKENIQTEIKKEETIENTIEEKVAEEIVKDFEIMDQNMKVSTFIRMNYPILYNAIINDKAEISGEHKTCKIQEQKFFIFKIHCTE